MPNGIFRGLWILLRASFLHKNLLDLKQFLGYLLFSRDAICDRLCKQFHKGIKLQK